ncbi:hypothetical protein ATE92_1055 [Ulvibacter sp. MAR_2010_11]|uniref:O-antigen ligase family protein n=1 Tax=Ulvibacter sp. MAR_2010_11 TaxID=1250229 RepID=UPI000C2C51BE|nr:O-antigen ligase family protein [Ulvibacter sp. MAR_2010_11]PKA82914.1 hypothetical protein ATE92_1055 [Ulvibacter sp. MAR_2010_11]
MPFIRTLNILKKNALAIAISFVLISLTVKESINSIAIIIFTIVCFFHRHNGRLKLNTYVSFLLYFGCICLSLFLTREIDNVQKVLLRSLPFLVFPFCFSFIIISTKTYNKATLVFIFWMVLCTFYSHSVMLNRLFENGDNLNVLFRKDYSYIELSNTIGLHPTYYSFFLLFCIIILLNKILFSQPRKHTYLYIIITFYFSFFIVHLSSRLNILALVLLILGYIFYYFIKKRNIISAISYLLLSMLIISFLLYNVRATRYRFQQIFGFTFSNGVHHEDGLNKIKQFEAVYDANSNFFVGNGITNANQDIFSSYRAHGLDSFANKKYNAHNQYLQTFVEMGIVGESLLLFILGYYLILFKRRRFHAGFTFVLLISLLFLTESYLVRHNGIVLVVFFLCLAANYASFNSPSLEVERKGNTSIIKNQRK